MSDSFQFKCPLCEQDLECPFEVQGVVVKCPSCDNEIVPDEEVDSQIKKTIQMVNEHFDTLDSKEKLKEQTTHTTEEPLSNDNQTSGKAAGCVGVFVLAIIIYAIFQSCYGSDSYLTNHDTKYDLLKQYHARGEFQGYSDPYKLQQDMETLGASGSKEAAAVAAELQSRD